MSKTLSFDVQKMMCGGCSANAESTVTKLAGVESASFDHETDSGTVVGDVDPQAVIDALAAEGYPARLKSG